MIVITGNEVVAVETKSLSIPCFDAVLSEYLYDPYSKVPNYHKFWVYVLFEGDEVAKIRREVKFNRFNENFGVLVNNTKFKCFLMFIFSTLAINNFA